MNSEIVMLINRAAESSKAHGCLACTLHRTIIVLKYEFAYGIEAELFKEKKLLLAEESGFRYELNDINPCVVFEYR